MEINKMITISAMHIKSETYGMLQDTASAMYYIISPDLDISLSAYEKADRGYFIHISDDWRERNMPEDLRSCIDFAVKHGCEWLCLEGTGDIVDLPVYGD